MNDSVKSASRALDILELYASSERALALRDVAEILGLPKSSAHMLLATLEKRGYLLRAGAEGFTLPSTPDGPANWVGGVAGQIFRAAQPLLEALRNELRETVVLGMPTPALDMRIVSHRVSPQAIRYDISDTAVIPTYCTAMGQIMLAHLPEDQVMAYLERTDLVALTRKTIVDPTAIIARLRQVRARGYALNIDERFEGAGGAAIAICDQNGRPHAAVNVVTVTPRFRARQSEIVAALVRTGQELEALVFGAPNEAVMTTAEG